METRRPDTGVTTVRRGGAAILKRCIREPLLHFLLAGALFFVVFAWLHRGVREETRVVHITEADVKWLADTWARQWQRPPDEQELRGVVADYLKQTLLELEARELKLDEGDTVVRRRLAQKMEFLVQDAVRIAEPGEDELRRLYQADRDSYQTPARISFTQIFFKTRAAAQQGSRDVATVAAADIGDPSLLAREYDGAGEPTVAGLFGDDFAGEIFTLEPGEWHGPVASAFGFHLVRVTERRAPQLRPFEEVRPQVQEAWYRARQDEANKRLFTDLLAKYDVVVDESVQNVIGSLAEVAK